MNEFRKKTQCNLEALKVNQEISNKNREASIKNFETQIGQLSKQLPTQSSGDFNENTLDDPMNDEFEKEVEEE